MPKINPRIKSIDDLLGLDAAEERPMQVTHPQQYDYCINKLGCGAVLDYIGVPYRNQQLEVDHC